MTYDPYTHSRFDALSEENRRKKMYQLPGGGLTENQPLIYTGDNGQLHIQHGGVLRNSDGTLHSAYEFTPGTSGGNTINSLIEKWKRGEPLTEEERAMIERFNASKGTLPDVPSGRSGTSLKNAKKKTTV